MKGSAAEMPSTVCVTAKIHSLCSSHTSHHRCTGTAEDLIRTHMIESSEQTHTSFLWLHTQVYVPNVTLCSPLPCVPRYPVFHMFSLSLHGTQDQQKEINTREKCQLRIKSRSALCTIASVSKLFLHTDESFIIIGHGC